MEMDWKTSITKFGIYFVHSLLSSVVCPRPANIPHGSYEGNNFASGGSVKYSCDETYTLEGPSLLLCIDGHWNGELPVCRGREIFHNILFTLYI